MSAAIIGVALGAALALLLRPSAKGPLAGATLITSGAGAAPTAYVVTANGDAFLLTPSGIRPIAPKE